MLNAEELWSLSYWFWAGALGLFIPEPWLLLLRFEAVLGRFEGEGDFKGDGGHCTGVDSMPKRLLIVFYTAI